MRLYIQLFFFVFFGFSCHFSLAQTNALDDYLKIGRVQFETSSSSLKAKAHFNLGVKFLHNFMYPLALREFQLAQRADPNFALSYWGQAMCYKWSLWSYENKKKGLAVIQAFQALQKVSMTPLEKGLMDAVSELYQPGADLENEKKYLHAMRGLYEQYPKHVEVISFYALAMIGYAMDAPYEKNGTELLDEARQFLKTFISTYPAHPGIIHYYMHVNDVPNSPYPREGMAVINNVYQYLSDSSHVLHMPSHLYTALGMWSEAAEANALSIKASHHMCRFLKKEKIHIAAIDANAQESSFKKIDWTQQDWYACDADNVYHSMEWLHYDYLQMGYSAKAEQLVKQMQDIARIENEPVYDFWAYRMLARQILYTKSYKPVSAMPKPLIEVSKDKNWAAYSECGLLLAQGVSAAHNKQLDYLSLIDKRFDNIQTQLTNPSSTGYKDACMLAKAEVLAYKHAFVDHDVNALSNELNNAQKIQEQLQSSHESLTLPYIPAQELYGELMMGDKKYWPQILVLYKNELKFNPNRALALEGLAGVRAKLKEVSSS